MARSVLWRTCCAAAGNGAGTEVSGSRIGGGSSSRVVWSGIFGGLSDGLLLPELFFSSHG